MLAVNWDRYLVCIECERELDTAFDPAFPIEDDEGLCLECGLMRGGIYDAEHQIPGFVPRT
jgi:hypothetical protein